MPLMFGIITFNSNSYFVIVPLLFVSISILCEFAMLPGVYILLSSQEEEDSNMYTPGSTFINLLSVFILVCLGITQKNKTASSVVLLE